MIEMTQAAGAPEKLSPSLQQWRELVDSCAGLVANSTFGIHAEHFMKLDGHRKIADYANGYGSNGRGVKPLWALITPSNQVRPCSFAN